MSEQPVVLVSREGAVAHLQINRPQMKNAINLATYGALADGLEKAVADSTVRSILLSGVGGNFSSGNDLADFASGLTPEQGATMRRFMMSLYRCEKPVVAAVEGFAVGIGMTMLLHCDLVYAQEDATFLLPFTSLGVCAEFSSSLLLPRLVGHQKAMELLLLGAPFDGFKAEKAGLVNEVVHGDVIEFAMKKARQLAGQPPRLVRLNKRLARAETYESGLRVLEEELEFFIDSLSGPECKEAITAFMQKRKPDFSGFD